MRHGQNALEVIERVKARIREIEPGLAPGVRIVPVYDRSDLIARAIATLERTLTEESIIVALVCIVFLLHVRSALVAIIMLPVGVLLAFAGMKVLGLSSHASACVLSFPRKPNIFASNLSGLLVCC